MELLDSAMMKKKTRRSDLFVFFFVWVSSFFVFFAFLSFCDEAIETSDGKKMDRPVRVGGFVGAGRRSLQVRCCQFFKMAFVCRSNSFLLFHLAHLH